MSFRFLSDLPAGRRVILLKLPHDIPSEELISSDRDSQLSPTLPVLVSENKVDYQLFSTVSFRTRHDLLLSFPILLIPRAFHVDDVFCHQVDCTYRCRYGILTLISLIHT